MHEGKAYGFIPSWHCHQVINCKEQESVLPKPYDKPVVDPKAIELKDHQEAVAVSPVDEALSAGLKLTDAEEDKLKTVHAFPLVNKNLPLENLTSSCDVAAPRVDNASPTREARVSHALITRSQVRISFHGNSRGEKEKEGNIGKGKGKEQEIILAEDNKVAGKAENPPKNGPNPMPLQLKAISHNEVANLFDFWCQTMNQAHAKLDKPRRELILAALKMGYSVEELRTAILGCAATPFNMGQNERGELFNGLHIILRDASHIDRFIQHYHHPPFYFTPCPKRQQNIQAVQSWLAKKMSSSH
jgi:hypothetical protein